MGAACPGDNITTVFAFTIAGQTADAGELALEAVASSPAAGTSCSVLSVARTGACRDA